MFNWLSINDIPGSSERHTKAKMTQVSNPVMGICSLVHSFENSDNKEGAVYYQLSLLSLFIFLFFINHSIRLHVK